MAQNTENSVHSERDFPARTATDSGSSQERAIEHIHAHAERIKQREIETALTKLENQGSLTETQREAVTNMANELVAELITPPTQALQNVPSSNWSDVRVALELFDFDSLSNENR
jgi:glutamyl-tRNA reductase